MRVVFHIEMALFSKLLCCANDILTYLSSIWCVFVVLQGPHEISRSILGSPKDHPPNFPEPSPASWLLSSDVKVLPSARDSLALTLERALG
jgi:hypothetical protein